MRQTTLSWKASPLQIQKNKLVRIIRAVIDTKIGQYLAAKIFTEINSKRYSYKNYRGFSTLEGSFLKYRSGISKPLQEKRRKFDAWAAYRRQKSYEHLSKSRRVRLDIRYLVRHSIPNWSGRLPLNPVQRPRATFFYFSFRHCRPLVLSHHPPRCRMRAKKGGREGIEEWSRILLRWNYGKRAFLFFLWFFSFQSSSVRLTLFTNGTKFVTVVASFTNMEYGIRFEFRIKRIYYSKKKSTR